MFPEALMLHYLDDLDSKMESMRAQFEREAGSENPWTGYNSSLGRPLLNSKKFLVTEAASPEQPPSAASPEAALSTTPLLPGLESEQPQEKAVAAAAHPDKL
jgi:3'-5' exoribonuclease